MDEQPETTTPIKEKDSFSWRIFVLGPFVVLILYVLSFGPVLRMHDKGRIGENQIAAKIYGPWMWAYSHDSLRKPLGMYLHLWVPDLVDKNGDPEMPF